MRISILHYTVILALFFVACKGKEVTIEPITIPSPTNILERNWEIIQTKAEVNATIKKI
jgi:hypothetical protein